jgi:hypothetical protein
MPGIQILRHTRSIGQKVASKLPAEKKSGHQFRTVAIRNGEDLSWTYKPLNCPGNEMPPVQFEDDRGLRAAISAKLNITDPKAGTWRMCCPVVR